MSVFEKGSEIVKYFEMLPHESIAAKLYRKMLQSEKDDEKAAWQALNQRRGPARDPH